MSQTILILDVGTSSMRACLFELNGMKKLTVVRRYQPIYYHDGRIEQDALALKNVLLSILNEIASQAKVKKYSIDAIAMTAQRSSIAPVDEKGEALMDFIMWEDKRAQVLCDKLESAQSIILKRSGSRLNAVFSGSKMAWLHEYQKDLYDKAYKLVNIPEYLLHMMTGNFYTDTTYGSRSNLMNIHSCAWDKDLLAIFGIDEVKLCTLLPPGSIVGYTTKAIATATGLAKGIPVISAGGDQQCAMIGQGAYEKGHISIVTGTGAFLSAISDEVPSDLNGEVICNVSSLPNRYILEANVLTCCSAFDWFVENFYGNPIDYHMIEKDLKSMYGKTSSCIVLPYFQGRGTPDWNAYAKASFHNITLSTSRAEMLQALLNGIFMEVKNNIDTFRQYTPICEGYISGGLTKTDIINQMQADMYGVVLYRLADSESTSLGAFLVALLALHVYEDPVRIYSEILESMEIKTFVPNPKQYEINCRKQKQMQELYAFETR